jgi:hypothetical protein
VLEVLELMVEMDIHSLQVWLELLEAWGSPEVLRMWVVWLDFITTEKYKIPILQGP